MPLPRLTSRVALLSCASLLSASLPAAAQNDADRATARELAKEGLSLKKAGDCKGALEVLRRAQALYDAPTHLLAIAQCQAQLGQLVEAAETYRKLGRAELGPKSPPAFRKAQEVGERELAELVPKMATLVILVDPDGVAGLSLKLDGESLLPQILGAPRPTNPGDHQIEVDAPGYETSKVSVKLKEGERQKVTLALRRLPAAGPPPGPSSSPSATAAPPATTTPPRPPPPPPMLPPEKEGPSRRTWGYALGGVGVASVLVGGYFGLSAIAKKSDRDAECDSTGCSSAGKSIEKDAFKAANLSTVFFGVGLVGLGAGAYLVLTSSDQPGAAALRLGPGNVQISGRFLCAGLVLR